LPLHTCVRRSERDGYIMHDIITHRNEAGSAKIAQSDCEEGPAPDNLPRATCAQLSKGGKIVKINCLSKNMCKGGKKILFCVRGG